MNRQGSIAVVDDKGRERERYAVVYGAKVKVNEGDPVTLGQVMVEWDPYTFAILTEIGARSSSRTCRKASRCTRGGRSHRSVTSRRGGFARREAPASHRDQRQGQQAVPDALPRSLMVQDGDTAAPGDVLAKIPRETTKTKDITVVCRGG